MDRTPKLRTLVIKEAARLFGRYGYNTTSVDLVERELRLSDVPDYFGDFETLAKAAFEYGVDRSDQVLDEAVSAHQGALNQLAGLIGGFRALVEYPPSDGGCPVFAFSPNVPGAFPFLRSSAQHAVSRWRHRIRRLVRTGIRNGEIHPRANPEEVSSILLSTLEGSVAMYLLYEDASHLDRAQAHLSAYLSELGRER